jgi:SAM-dependent methyltransferase
VTPSIERHREELARNRAALQRKPVLAAVYRDFHELIAARVAPDAGGATVELGSGGADISAVLPGCVRTDLFPGPGIDRVENAYALSFADSTLGNLILFDVFHHLRHPGTALAEFARVLRPGGRLILFEPCLSLLGWLVYGAIHPEPVARLAPIAWRAPPGWSPDQADYYAAQGNATRIFLRGEFRGELSGWTVRECRRLSALAYVASGGYSGPQLYPARLYPVLRGLERVCDLLPALFATRLLVALERR